MMNAASSAGGMVEHIYEELKGQAISFALKPGSRINEGEIARRLGVSRTPLREALNRLAAAGFLMFEPSKGFFRKPFAAVEIFDLYELRQAIEVAAARLAAERALEAQLDELEAFLSESARQEEGRTVDQLVQFDEGFHERIVQLTGNAEMLASLRNINDRIRFFRWIDMESERRQGTQQEHRRILEALRRHDGEAAAGMLQTHIAQRREQIIARVREGYARIYVDDKGPVA